MENLLEKPSYPKITLASLENPNLFITIPVPLQTISDRDLIRQCKEYGGNARRWSREFAYLLPEVYRRGLHRRCGCESIFHFAAKYAGMNREVVGRVLNVGGKLKDRPVLWAKIRECGWTKLSMIIGVLDEKTEEEWLEILKVPKEAMRILVRKIRMEKRIAYLTSNAEVRISNNSGPFAETCGQYLLIDKPKMDVFGNLGTEGLSIQNNENASSASVVTATRIQSNEIFDVATPQFSKIKMTVSLETELEFRAFKIKVEKEKRKSLTNGETLKLLMEKLKKYEEKSAKTRSLPAQPLKKALTSEIQPVNKALTSEIQPVNKALTSEIQPINKALTSEIQPINKALTSEMQPVNKALTSEIQPQPEQQPELKPATSRYISVDIRSAVTEKYGRKCVSPWCKNPSLEFHHPERFATTGSHLNIKPLCRNCHQLAHFGFIKNELQDAERWGLVTKSIPSAIDLKVQQHWRG